MTMQTRPNQGQKPGQSNFPQSRNTSVGNQPAKPSSHPRNTNWNQGNIGRSSSSTHRGQ